LSLKNDLNVPVLHGCVNQRYGSENPHPDPYQNVTAPTLEKINGGRGKEKQEVEDTRKNTERMGRAAQGKKAQSREEDARFVLQTWEE
jgi:hypothetical protein